MNQHESLTQWFVAFIIVIIFLVVLACGITLYSTTPSPILFTTMSQQIAAPLPTPTTAPALAQNLGEEPLQTYLIALATSSPAHVFWIVPRSTGGKTTLIGHIVSYSLNFVCLDYDGGQTCINFADILYWEMVQ